MVAARGLVLGDILRGIDLQLPVASCTGVMGLNGAGKSTLLSVLAGVIVPDEGELQLPSPLAYLPEGCPLDPWIPVRRWLALARSLPGWDDEVGGALVHELPIPAERSAGQLSQGQRVRLGLILTLGRRAPLYVLDDPFLGLDPVAQVVAERWNAHRSAEATVVMASQHAGATERLCSHLAFLREGELMWCAPVDSWRERFRRVRVHGSETALRALGVLVLHAERRGAVTEVLLDDPGGSAEARLRAAGCRVEHVPLPLDELLMGMVAA